MLSIARACAAVLLVMLCGCGSGIPKIPDSPDDILRDGDKFFDRGRLFQSQELYKAFLQRHPGLDRSDYAQFKLAETYFGQEEYALAAIEYRILVTNYGYSDYVDDGYFKEAVCFYEQCPKPSLDQTMCYEALERFSRFVQVFSRSELVPQALEYTTRIHEKLADKDFRNAMFYYRAKKYVSSLVYLTKVIDNYPDNDYWCRALYYKALILIDREEEEEAIRLLSRAIEYPRNIPEKRAAERKLREFNPRQSQR